MRTTLDMRTFTYEELSERAQEAVIGRYALDADYQEFVDEMAKINPEDLPMVDDWARERNIRFNEHGERIA